MGKSLIAWDGGGGGSPSGAFSGIGGLTNSTTEAQVQYYISEAATFSYLQARIPTGGSGTNTITFRDTGVNTSLAASRAGTGALSDAVNTATVAATDLVSVAFTDTGSDPIYSFISVVVSFSSGHGSFHQSQNAALVYDVASSTRFVPVNGVSTADGTATEANAQFKNRAYTSWESLQVYVQANARVNTSTVNNRINGVDGAASISITAGATGMFTDNTVSDALSAGDLLCASVVLDTGVEDLTIRSFGATFKNSSASKCDVVTQTAAGVARTASGTEDFFAYAGGIRTRAQTAAAIPAPYDFRLSNPRIYLSANTYTANANYKIYKSSTASITVTLTAATTGWFEDTTNTIDYVVGDTFYYGIVGGTSGSATSTAAAVTLLEVTNVSISATGLEATGAVGSETVSAAANVTETGLAGTGETGTVTVSVSIPVSVSVTGVEATGAVGTATVSAAASVTETGLEGTGEVGTATVTGVANTTTTGVEATGAVGTVTVSAAANVTETGVEGTGEVGTATVSAAAETALTGLEATGEVGDVAISAAANVTETGLEGTGETGTVTVDTSGAVEVSVTGVEGTGETGTATIEASANTTLTGVEGTGQVGDALVAQGAEVNPTGLEATGSVGDVTISAAASVTETGLEGTGEVGTATVSLGQSISVTGLSGTGQLGTVTISAAANDTLTGVEGTGEVGTPTVDLTLLVPVTGVSATGEVGTITVQAGAAIAVTGVQASGLVSSVLVWGQINTNQTPDWQAVNDAQTPGWIAINDGNTVTWQTINDSQTPGWVAIDDGNTVTWVEILT